MQIDQVPFCLSLDELALIELRLAEFQQLNKLENDEWFSELCFCLLTANSQAQRAITIQAHIGTKGFLEYDEELIAGIIKSFGHRFHNKKSNYIVLARKFKNIKDLLEGKTSAQAREFLVANVKGLGYKEASHFLRNVGYADLAIVDRHIIKFLYQYKLINEIPATITKKQYLLLEDLLKRYQIELHRLDLMIWCYITGKILK